MRGPDAIAQLGQRREPFQHCRNVGCAGTGYLSELQVFQNGKFWKNLSALGNVAQSQTGAYRGRHSGDVATGQMNCPGLRT